jgi:hypothetical protein
VVLGRGGGGFIVFGGGYCFFFFYYFLFHFFYSFVGRGSYENSFVDRAVSVWELDCGDRDSLADGGHYGHGQGHGHGDG